MHRAMRRKDRAISDAEGFSLLEKGEWGMLSLQDSDGQPYGVPLSYVVVDGCIYFHSAKEGRKVDCIAHNPKASFCVVGKTQPVYDTSFTTYFESVMVSGVVGLVHDAKQRFSILQALAEKYLPEHMQKADEEITRSLQRTAVYRLSIDHLAAKAKRPSTAKKQD